MEITLSRDERPILLAKLGLPAKATNAEITAAVAQRLTGPAPAPAVAQPAIASRQADGHDLIAAAVRDGRIPAQRADHYADRYARDPEGTAALIAKLAPVPTQVLNATAANAPTDYPRDWLAHPGRGGSRVTVE